MKSMPRRRKIIWLGLILLVLAGGFGGYYWHWQATATDRKVCELVYEAAGYPDTRMEKRIREWKLDFLLREKPKPREGDDIKKKIKAIGNSATPGLISLLDDENDDVRRKVVVFLEIVGDARAVDPLIHALEKDKDMEVRMYSAEALVKFGDKRAVEPLIQVMQRYHNTDVLEPPRTFTTPLKVLLQCNNRSVCRASIIALGKLGDKRAIEPLIQALQTDQDSDVRLWAAEALGKLGDKRAVVPLIQALQKYPKAVHSRAAEALGELGDPRAISALEKALQKETDPYYQRIFKEAIAMIKPAATKPGQSAMSTAPASQAN